MPVPLRLSRIADYSWRLERIARRVSWTVFPQMQLEQAYYHLMESHERLCGLCARRLSADARADRRYCDWRCRNARWKRDNLEKDRAIRWSWQVRNRAHRAEIHRRWYELNREAVIRKTVEWQRENRVRRNVYLRGRRERISSEHWTADDFDRAAALLDGACSYCGSTDNLTLDHVVPLARGGQHRVENLVAACKPCNSRKHAREELEFRALLALEAFIEGRRRRLSEAQTPYCAAWSCRDPRQERVAICDTNVGSCNVRWQAA